MPSPFEALPLLLLVSLWSSTARPVEASESTFFRRQAALSEMKRAQEARNRAGEESAREEADILKRIQLELRSNSRDYHRAILETGPSSPKTGSVREKAREKNASEMKSRSQELTNLSKDWNLRLRRDQNSLQQKLNALGESAGQLTSTSEKQKAPLTKNRNGRSRDPEPEVREPADQETVLSAEGIPKVIIFEGAAAP